MIANKWKAQQGWARLIWRHTGLHEKGDRGTDGKDGRMWCESMNARMQPRCRWLPWRWERRRSRSGEVGPSQFITAFQLLCAWSRWLHLYLSGYALETRAWGGGPSLSFSSHPIYAGIYERSGAAQRRIGCGADWEDADQPCGSSEHSTFLGGDGAKEDKCFFWVLFTPKQPVILCLTSM